MSSFAFFDLDHTLLPFDTQTLFANFVLKKERWRTAYLLAFAPFALLKAAKVVTTVTAKRAFMSYVWGMKREQLQAEAREFAETEVKRWVYPEVWDIIEGHRQAGRTLILNTASPDLYPHEIARVLGFHHCIATEVQQYPVMPFLPKIARNTNNKRAEKIVNMKRLVPAVANATPEELKDSWAYSDSKADLPLLELAGNAVLIHPNEELEELGKERGWTVLRPVRPYANHTGAILSSALQAFGLDPR